MASPFFIDDVICTLIFFSKTEQVCHQIVECLEPDSYKKAPDMYVYDCGSIVAARDIPLGGASNWSKADLRVVLQCGNATWTCGPVGGETLFRLKREAHLFLFFVVFHGLSFNQYGCFRK